MALKQKNAAKGSVGWSEIRPHLDAALDTLPAAQRQVILLHHMAGKKRKVVAAELGVSEETVKKRLQRGLSRLREPGSTRRSEVGAALAELHTF